MSDQVVKSQGKWHLVYHPTLDGRHSFSIQRITHCKELYDCISLEKALERFDQIIEEYGED